VNSHYGHHVILMNSDSRSSVESARLFCYIQLAHSGNRILGVSRQRVPFNMWVQVETLDQKHPTWI